jgi:hypothetical protein
MIRLQTSTGRDIPNVQGSEISAFEKNWASDLQDTFPRVILRTSLSALYNCHGLTLASRRTRLTDPIWVTRVLEDDKYENVSLKDALPGDLVMYYGDDGDATHSGIVVSNEPPLFVPRVLSKWGSGPEVIHQLHDVPSVYGTHRRVLRCRL